MGELRERKKLETRRRISDVATALFFERGFDAVTVDEIAAAAGVSKVTVFNYFTRKEDLHVDREEEVKALLREAIATRPKGESPVDALRRLADRLVAEQSPYACVSSLTVGWWRVVAASPSLQARLRELGDTVTESLAFELSASKPDGRARLVAGMVVLTWRTAYSEAIRVFEGGGSAKKVSATFIQLIDRGFAAVRVLAARAQPDEQAQPGERRSRKGRRGPRKRSVDARCEEPREPQASSIGRLRMRCPVRRNSALHTAGAIGGVAGSPMPVIGAPESMMATSISGASFMRKTR